MHTRQESFEISSLALITQGHPGVDEDGCCSYDNGCAAAHLIPVDEWRSLAGFADQLGNRDLFIAAGHDPDFVRSLQIVHDRAVKGNRGETDCGYTVDVASWRCAWLADIRQFAHDHSLNIAPVLEAAKAADWEIPE